MIALLTACGVLMSSPPPCPAHVIAVSPHTQSGPTCLVAAGLTAVSPHSGKTITVREVAREVPVWPDGVDGYDLTVAMAKRGWDSLLFTGPPEAAARLVEAGFPAVALVTHQRRIHAVTVHGAQRKAAEAGGCGRALDSLLVLDPRTARSTWESASAFAERQSAERWIVFYRPQDAHKLDDRGFPLAIAQRVDRRLRAQALVRRAKKHPQANEQSLVLLQQAHALDPCWPRVRQLLQDTLIRLKRPHTLPALTDRCKYAIQGAK